MKKVESMPDEIDRQTTKEAKRGLRDVKRDAKKNLEAHDAIYRKRAKRSMEVTTDRDEVTASLEGGGPEAPHFKYVEFGTGQYFGEGGSLCPRGHWSIRISLPCLSRYGQ